MKLLEIAKKTYRPRLRHQGPRPPKKVRVTVGDNNHGIEGGPPETFWTDTSKVEDLLALLIYEYNPPQVEGGIKYASNSHLNDYIGNDMGMAWIANAMLGEITMDIPMWKEEAREERLERWFKELLTQNRGVGLHGRRLEYHNVPVYVSLG